MSTLAVHINKEFTEIVQKLLNDKYEFTLTKHPCEYGWQAKVSATVHFDDNAFDLSDSRKVLSELIDFNSVKALEEEVKYWQRQTEQFKEEAKLFRGMVCALVNNPDHVPKIRGK